MTVAGEWLGEQEYATRTMAHILTVLYLRPITFPASRPCIGKQLERLLVHAYHGEVIVVRTTVHLEHILHAGREVRALLLGDAPFLDQMGLEAVPSENIPHRRVAYTVYILHFYNSF